MDFENTIRVPNHAVVVVGYRREPDGSLTYKIKNSWGNSWGEYGFAYFG